MKSRWQYTGNEMLGKVVIAYENWGEEFRGIVVGVHTERDLIKVMDFDTWEVLVGNQWEEE